MQDRKVVYRTSGTPFFGNSALLYFAWVTQRHHQCCIHHTEQFLNGPCCMAKPQGHTHHNKARHGQQYTQSLLYQAFQAKLRELHCAHETLISCDRGLNSYVSIIYHKKDYRTNLEEGHPPLCQLIPQLAL